MVFALITIIYLIYRIVFSRVKNLHFCWLILVSCLDFWYYRTYILIITLILSCFTVVDINNYFWQCLSLRQNNSRISLLILKQVFGNFNFPRRRMLFVYIVVVYIVFVGFISIRRRFIVSGINFWGNMSIPLLVNSCGYIGHWFYRTGFRISNFILLGFSVAARSKYF